MFHLNMFSYQLNKDLCVCLHRFLKDMIEHIIFQYQTNHKGKYIGMVYFQQDNQIDPIGISYKDVNQAHRNKGKDMTENKLHGQKLSSDHRNMYQGMFEHKF